MPTYRRWYVEGGTYFFTVVSHLRRPILTTEWGRRCLRSAIDAVRRRRPFDMPAIVLLPDHLHTIWTLPPGDSDYSTRWRLIKARFTSSYLACGGSEIHVSRSRRKRRERGIWQRRAWEHTLRDEHDFDRHFDYIHWNPLKHGLVQAPRDWEWSTFHGWVESGVYEIEWGSASRGALDFGDLDQTAMEPQL
jgi:putative transposase